MAEEQNSTQELDDAVPSSTEDQMLADILSSSEILNHTGEDVPEPQPQVDHQDSAETVEDEDLEYTEEAATEDEVESDDVDEVEDEQEEEGDDKSTPEESYAIDDLEDIMVTHKVDGEEITQPLSEWVAGSATKQHLSKQGRELGEARKEFEAQRDETLKELEAIGSAVAQKAYGEETKYQKDYHELSQKMEKARKDDDTYELGELAKKQKDAQENYWKARNERESLVKSVQEQQQRAQQEAFEKDVAYFNEHVTEYIPDWSESVQKDVREFALEKGLPEAIVDTVTNPAIVKLLDDYRRLEQNIESGAKKRVKAPVKKMPAKKGKAPAKKKQDAEKMVHARAMRDNASPEDHMDYLRQHASKTLFGS